MAGPLEGIRVVDLTANVMGPYATLQLADMGADVWKIEPPVGDAMRNVGPSRHRGMGSVFMHLNRNKRSVALDLKKPAGIDLLLRMIDEADVLVYSLRPQAMQRLGLSYDDVRARNPRIVYCGAFGFGQDGPYAARPAYDDLIQAASGSAAAQGRKIGPPQYAATPVGDRGVGLALAMAVLAALVARERTGVGQAVEVPMFETFAHLVMSDHLYGLTFDPPIGEWGYARSMDPKRRPFETADGRFVAVNLYIDKHWQAFFELSGHAALIDDPRFVDVHARQEHQGQLYDFLIETMRTKSADEWLDLLVAADIPAIEAHTPESLLSDKHMTAVGFFVDEEHPSEGKVRGMAPAARFNGARGEIRYPAPRLGEHSANVLAELGIDEEDVARLVSSGVVSVPEPADHPNLAGLS